MSDYGHSPSRLLRWLVVGPVAIGGLVAVVAGGPLLLMWLGGNPLPQRWLTTSELVEVLISPDDGQLLIRALTVVGWVAWAVIAGSLLLELAAQLTGRRTPQVPGFSGPQRLASLLVAGVLAALTAPGIGHAHAAYLDEPVAVAQLDPAAGTPAGWPAAPAQPGWGSQPGVAAQPAAAGQPGVAAQPEPEPVAQAEPEQLVHEVAPGDWMWHIAGRYLGDELRYPEIAELNPQYAQLYQNYPDHIQPGDQLVLPPDAEDRGERRHATGELAGEPPAAEGGAAPPAAPEEESPAPEGEAAAPVPSLSPQRPAPPELLDPIVPDPAAPEQTPAEPATEPPATDPPAPPTGSPALPTPPPATSPPGTPSGVPATPPVTTAPPAAGGPPAAGSPPPQEAAPPGFPSPPGAGPAPGADSGDQAAEGGPSLGPLLTTGVLASALVGALVLYRWQKFARRRYRRTVSAAGAAAAESGLRAGATADVARLDRALRVLAATRPPAGQLAGGSGPPGGPPGGDGPGGSGPPPGGDGPGAGHNPAAPPPVPDIGAVWIGEGEIHLILAAPYQAEVPEPFHASGPGGWFLPAEVDLPAAGNVLAPLPALVTIGSRPGQHLLVELERMGMLTVTGPAERGSDLLRYLVAELAHNPWSERVEVTVAGFAESSADALIALNPDRIRAAGSLPEAVNQLRSRLAHTTGTLEAHELADSVHGRVTDTSADTWNPQLLLVDQPGPEHDELLTYLEGALAAAGRRAAVAVVVTAPAGVPYGRRSIQLTADGLLRAGFLDESHPMPAAALPEHLLGPLAELMRDAAAGPDHPIPPASESWAKGTDATGGRVVSVGRVRLTSTNPAAGTADPAAAPEPAPDLATEPAPDLAAEPAAEPAPDLAAEPAAELAAEPAEPAGPVGAPESAAAPPPAAELAGPVGARNGGSGSDPGDGDSLDKAVAQWLRDADQPPRISLLGPVRVHAPGPSPSHRARVCQELVVYLAARGEQGADAAEIAGQLWPGQPPDPAVRTAVLTSARRWLGTGPDGQPWLTEAGPDGRYRLREGPLLDWHLFRRLRTRGERRGAAGAADLRAALRLVRGAPLADAGELAGASTRVPYSWLPGSPVAPELILAGIVDTAHQLVALSLADGELAGAYWAVQQAWLADPRRADDHPWRDLLRIRHAEGDVEAMRAIVAELLRWRDAEHPDELTPATRELIRQLVPYQSAGAGARR